jgi:hypothetical protein
MIVITVIMIIIACSIIMKTVFMITMTKVSMISVIITCSASRMSSQFWCEPSHAFELSKELLATKPCRGERLRNIQGTFRAHSG